jgi:hypothetical protein
MVRFRTLAYNVVLIPALLLAPGCGSEPAKVPEGAPTGGADELTPPTTDLGTESTDTPGEPTEGEADSPESN